MLICRRNNIDGKTYYMDAKTKVAYNGTVSAFAWPHGDQKGCFIVLAEHYFTPNTIRPRRTLTVLHEYTSFSSEKLLVEADQKRKPFLISKLITDTLDDRYIHVEEFNDRLIAHRKTPLNIDHPEFWHGKGESMMPHFIELINRRIGEGQKSLYFGTDSAARTAAQSITSKEMSKSPRYYPALLALGWCIEFFDAKKDFDDSLLAKQDSFAAIDDIGGY